MGLVLLCGSCEAYLIMHEPHNVAAVRSLAARHGWTELDSSGTVCE